MSATSSKNSIAFGLASAMLLFSTTLPATAEPVSSNVGTGPGLSITLHGFLDASVFWQDQDMTFGNGQNGEFPLPNTRRNHDLSGFDVRNTRAWLDIKGATLSNGWAVGGHLEGDFFGGFNGTGAFSSQQETPRLRQAFIKLTNGSGSSLIIGQQWDLLFPLESVPESLTHIAFPLGLGTGMIGWRFPGVVWMQALGQPQKGAMAWRLDLGAFSGSWNGPGSNVNFDTAANTNFRPQIEARLRAQQGDWLGYL
ncbi:MAG: hypothetical protein ACRETG_06755, partial [Steroidobacteraceae bacterium]